MHPERWRLIDELFHAASELPPNERGAFLASACDGDSSLRAEIQKLIDGSDRAGSFIETPAAVDLSAIPPPDSNPEPLDGLRLGSYEVIREIGRGGMGTVYLAARADEEFRKLVAIKLVTAGFDHASIIQRFRTERQILAGLDHPNIARLLDGGTTESGAPYFVMEYIEGQSIRDYCDSPSADYHRTLEAFRRSARQSTLLIRIHSSSRHKACQHSRHRRWNGEAAGLRRCEAALPIGTKARSQKQLRER